MKQPIWRLVLSGVLAAGLVSCGALAFAQEPGSAPESSVPGQAGGGGMGRRGMMMDPDEQLARLTKRYNLSADQQSQVKPILVDTQKQMQALHGDSSLSREDRMAKMQSIRSDSRTKIEAVLNDDQKKQFEADQQRMQQRMQGGGGPGAAPNAGGPPPQQ
jgi:Spy/CpxP family protein refolding chaperone